MRHENPELLLNWGDHPMAPLSAGLTAGPAPPAAVPAEPAADAESCSLLASLLLQWHQGARSWPAASVLARALELLALRLPFDGARWAQVATEPDAAGSAGVVLLFQQGLVADEDRPALTARQGEPLVACQLRLQLWREAGQAPFAEAEARLLQCLMPHLVDLWRESRFRPHGAAAAPRRCQAVCDLQGRLQQVDEGFMALLRQEWPQGPAAGLPLALRRWAVAAAAAQGQAPQARWQGRCVTVGLQAAGDVLQLDLRRRAPIDRLSPRQRDIAQRYAAGRSGPQIAAALGLSPSTVNNHLGLIFRRLGVGSKLQLAQLLRESPGWL